MIFGCRCAVPLAGLVLVLWNTGCARETTRPPVAQVRIALSPTPSTGGPSHPVALVVRVTNAGATRVWHCECCGCGNGIHVTVLGPDGQTVALHDPNAIGPACPDGEVPLLGGGALEAHEAFTGTLFERDSHSAPSPTYPAPAGTYTAIAGFSYTTVPGGEGISVERRATFVWKP